MDRPNYRRDPKYVTQEQMMALMYRSECARRGMVNRDTKKSSPK